MPVCKVKLIDRTPFYSFPYSSRQALMIFIREKTNLVCQINIEPSLEGVMTLTITTTKTIDKDRIPLMCKTIREFFKQGACRSVLPKLISPELEEQRSEGI